MPISSMPCCNSRTGMMLLRFTTILSCMMVFISSLICSRCFLIRATAASVRFPFCARALYSWMRLTFLFPASFSFVRMAWKFSFNSDARFNFIVPFPVFSIFRGLSSRTSMQVLPLSVLLLDMQAMTGIFVSPLKRMVPSFCASVLSIKVWSSMEMR